MATLYRCDVHPGRHTPTPQETERHHVIPRAWQGLWTPTTPTQPGHYAGELLWDARTVDVPPTCHRNVHHWIVAIMHLIVPIATGSDQRVALDRVARHLIRGQFRGRVAQTQEIAFAKLAPARFLDAGGDLNVLIAHGAWGEA